MCSVTFGLSREIKLQKQEQIEEVKREQISAKIHGTLDVVGMAPAGIGMAADGITPQGNSKYEIIIDAGKEIGTKGETKVKIVLSDDGGMLSAYPYK